MEGDATYDFPAISGGDVQHAGPRFDEARFGDVVTVGETLFQDVGGDWRKPGDWGPSIGTLTLTHSMTTVAGRVHACAVLVFDDGDTAIYQGLVPGNGSWKGKGRFGFVAGTGKFADRGGEIDVDSVNPKHWG